jgi:hypothetical protein
VILVSFGVASGGVHALRMMSACCSDSQPRASLIVRNAVGALYRRPSGPLTDLRRAEVPPIY